MLDMIHPAIPGKISLSDLKKCKMTSIFFDTFFNLEKYLDHEQRDPFASTRDHDADGHEVIISISPLNVLPKFGANQLRQRDTIKRVTR